MSDALVTIEPSEGIESTPRSPRRSALRPQIEVITRGARRSWSPEQKQQIVAESLAPGARPSEVIDKYGIGSGQLSMWRREFASPLQGMLLSLRQGLPELRLQRRHGNRSVR